MRGTRCFVGACALVAMLAGTTVIAPSVGAAGPQVKVLLDGLSSPKGVATTLGVTRSSPKGLSARPARC